MNLNVRYCRKCGKAYDVGTNYDICWECRGVVTKKKKKRLKDGKKWF